MKLLRSLSLAIGSLVVTLFVAEIALRIANFPPRDAIPWISDRETGFSFAPNLNHKMVRSEYDLIFKTNSLGIRDDELTSKSKFRILLLGDSFAAGFGVERGEIFADLVEKNLKIDVINAAIGGFEIIHQVQFYPKISKITDPDLVLYALYLGNDLTENQDWRVKAGSIESLKKRFPVQNDQRLKILELYRAARRALYSWLMEIEEWYPYDEYLELARKELTPKGQEFYNESFRLIEKLNSEVTSSGKKLVVLLIPQRTAIETDGQDNLRKKIPDLDSKYDLEKPETEVSSFLASKKIDFISVKDALTNASAAEKLPMYYKFDGHLTKYGHEVVARVLSAKLEGGSPDPPL